MNAILKLKHWQVFLILLFASITSNFTWQDHDEFNLLINLTGSIAYFAWYLILGLELTEFSPPRVELPRTMFIINSFFLIFSVIVLIAAFDGSYSGNGLFGFIWVVYMFYALFQFIFYPSRAFRTAELKKEVSFGQYFGSFLLIFFWPIGIWWIQPRINRIVKGR